ncbi:MAG: TetR/AcrR family transcriptional regulator [Pseudomonadota bacterium]
MAYQKTERVLAKSKETRERILRAVLQLVAEGGWRAVQIASVASIAGVAIGSVYRYFPDKGDLLAQAYGFHTAHETAVVGAITHGEGSALERLEAAIRTFAQRAVKGPKLAYAMLAEPSDIQVEAARLDHHARFGAHIQAILDSGVAAGELQCDNTALVATCIVGALRESLAGPLAVPAGKLRPGKTPVTSGIDVLCSFCLNAVTSLAPLKERKPA